MSVPAVEQVICAMQVLQGQAGGDRGVQKIKQLHDNANFMREKLRGMGCSILGDDNSPVMVSLHCWKPACWGKGAGTTMRSATLMESGRIMQSADADGIG